MLKKINVFKSLHIEANEIGPVLLLIVQSVFIGIFYGAFDIGAHTLFLKTYPEDMIPKAYIISGIVGIILTSIFSRYQSKINFSKLAIRTFLFISAITILMRVFFEFTDANWTVFLVFILLGPLNILAILAFWGTVGRIFNLRQGKRLYGIIDSGQVFGIIISSFAIPVLITYLQGTKNLLIICAISIIFAMLIEAIISRKYKVDSSTDIEDEETETIEHEQVKLKNFTKDPYILYMALFVIFSMFAAFFVQYSFLVVTNEQYPLEEDLAKYLGFFTGSMMAFTLIIKTFVYSKLMKTYGLKISLLLSSVLLILFTGVAIAVGYFSGFEKASPGFIYFFLFISMGKLFNKTLKDALEVPAFKLLYQSLKKTIRFDVQAKIDGTINEIAALTSGILLGTLSILAFIELIHFSVFLFVLLTIWAFVTVKLYKEYRNSLERALQQDISDDIKDVEDPIISQFKTLLKNPERFLIKLNHIKNYLPNEYSQIILNICKSFEPHDLQFLTREHLIEINLLYVQNLACENWSDYFIEKHNASVLIFTSIRELDTLLNSDSPSDINSAIQHLINQKNERHLTLLSGLLRVPNLSTQETAIRICGTISEIETVNTLVEFLDSQVLFHSALSALNQMGEKSVVYLIQMFYKSDISLTVQLSLIQIIGKYNTPESIDFLLNNISHHRKEIKEKSIHCLKDLEYQPSEIELPKMFHPITEISQTVAWDISALASLGLSYSDSHPLKIALEHEFEKHQKELIDLLAITYDATSVKHVQDYLASGTAEGISYGLELFDLFLSEEIKPMILSIFEDIPLSEKTRLFENFFPVEITSARELILNIINRDPNLICKETKRTALIEYTVISQEITNDIIAQLFSPVPELQRTAASIVNKIAPEKINQIKSRVAESISANLNKIDEGIEKSLSLFNISNSIIKAFNIEKNDLTRLTDFFEIQNPSNSHFLASMKNVNNYFVLLNANHAKIAHNIDVNLYINNNFDSNDIDFNNLEYCIGINKSMMNQLVLTHNKVIKDLINTIK
jgi:AAA family ATP:ADP antiporter